MLRGRVSKAHRRFPSCTPPPLPPLPFPGNLTLQGNNPHLKLGFPSTCHRLIFNGRPSSGWLMRLALSSTSACQGPLPPLSENALKNTVHVLPFSCSSVHNHSVLAIRKSVVYARNHPSGTRENDQTGTGTAETSCNARCAESRCSVWLRQCSEEVAGAWREGAVSRSEARVGGGRSPKIWWITVHCLLAMDSDSGSPRGGCLFFALADLSRPPPLLLDVQRGRLRLNGTMTRVGADSFVSSPYLQAGDSLATDWPT